MISTVKDIDPLVLEEQFYSKFFCFSYSSISKLMYSPKLFYSHYILNQREDKTDAHLVEGKLIHCMFLEPETVNDKFVLLPSLPGDSARTVIDKVYQLAKQTGTDNMSLNGQEEHILSVLKEINLHQSLKTDVQRIEKMITDQNSSYFDFLKVREGKDVMDLEMYTKCSQIVRDLELNSMVQEVIKIKSDDRYTVYNELPIQCEIPGMKMPFGIKGVLDNVTIDHELKVVIINDIKTTGKTLHDFPETVKFFNYWIQCAIYRHLVNGYEPIKELLSAGYALSFNFIVIDKYLQIYPFRVSETTYNQWFMELNNVVLPKINWHYQTRQFALPYEFATEDFYL